ncbi:hypothetical protein HBB16_09195 [Pseudonocardia sp. MCCB 268]|nr:hypothetical protein [Pseudonocardia cytotoxica]
MGGIRAHRAVDVAAGLPRVSTSTTSAPDALLDAVVGAPPVRERAAWEDLARRTYPTTPHELPRCWSSRPGGYRHAPHADAGSLRDPRRVRIHHPSLRAQLSVTGAGGQRVRCCRFRLQSSV